jgi:hypothetical protein
MWLQVYLKISSPPTRAPLACTSSPERFSWYSWPWRITASYKQVHLPYVHVVASVANLHFTQVFSNETYEISIHYFMICRPRYKCRTLISWLAVGKKSSCTLMKVILPAPENIAQIFLLFKSYYAGPTVAKPARLLVIKMQIIDRISSGVGKWGRGETPGARAPPTFFRLLKVPFFVMRCAFYCDEKCPFCTR